MSNWTYTLGSVGVVSLISLIGVVTLAWERRTLGRLIFPLVSLAVGALLGAALVHLIPHALHEGESEIRASLLVCAGVVSFFILDRAICAYRDSSENTGGVKSYVPMNLIGDGVHNLLDGMLIAAAFLAGTSIGLVVTAAVILHEVPSELGDFGVLIHGGLSVGKALLWNVLSALTAVAGAVFILLLDARVESISAALVPLAAGNFLYLAAAKLIPELQEQDFRLGRTVLQVALIAFGIALMVGATLIENEVGH